MAIGRVTLSYEYYVHQWTAMIEHDDSYNKGNINVQ